MPKARFALVLSLFCLCRPALASEIKNEGEAGIVMTTGNTRTQSYSLKDNAEVKNGKHTYAFLGTYLEAKQSGVQSAENWLLGLRYERELTEPLSLFTGQQVEGDKFAGILQRYNTDVGAKYYFSKLPKKFMCFAEGGYRFTREHTTRGEWNSFQKGRLYAEAQKHWNETVYSEFWLEYIPNFTSSKNWLVNGGVAVSAGISSVFAIKTSYTHRYNNAPPAGTSYRTDTTLTTALTATL